MKKFITLFILLFLVVAGVYLLGVFSESPIDSVFRIDSLVRRGQAAGPGQELNAAGIVELDSGDLKGAVTALREASRMEPENPVITRNLSIALARMANDLPDDEQTAISLLEEALELWPKNPEGLDGLSTIHFKATRYKAALESAMILQEMMPDRADLGEYVRHLQGKVADEQGMATEKGDHFRLLYSNEKGLEYSGELLALLQTQLDSLTAALGVFPEKPIDVLLLTDDLGTRAAPLDPSLEGLYNGQIRLYLGDGIFDTPKLILTVRHEMVHALLHQGAGNLPGWVQEGLAQKAGEEPDEDQIVAARRYIANKIRDGYSVDLSKMGISFINLDNESRTIAYATSLLFMDYLSLNYGSGFIPRFVSELVSEASPRDALRTLTGLTFAQLQVSFSEDLEKEYR
ncbi:MAG: hypothetical protein RRA15_13615 [bacterium]|nr:hypothetical protein [bacterium]MDT8367497.1 hypothetical protein [bacterium]